MKTALKNPSANCLRKFKGLQLTFQVVKYHRAERQEQQVQDEHLYEELKRLRKENVRLKEERDILKKAAAYFAQQLP